MGIYDEAAWGVIVGVALMLVGGLMLWAYGARGAKPNEAVLVTGPEAEATRQFHGKLARWFFLYAMVVIAVGGGLVKLVRTHFIIIILLFEDK